VNAFLDTAARVQVIPAAIGMEEDVSISYASVMVRKFVEYGSLVIINSTFSSNTITWNQIQSILFLVIFHCPQHGSEPNDIPDL
jgi:hypothetical protein